jgi:vacuolar-type H+-ATPase catalytic subunit A/Vma1
MKHTIKPTITIEEYAKQQIQDALNKEVIYTAQVRVLTKSVGDKEKKNEVIKALTALEQQIEAMKQTQEVWEEVYLEEKAKNKKNK